MRLVKFFGCLAVSVLSLNPLHAVEPERIGIVLQKNEFFSLDWENFKVPADMRLYLITSSNNNNIDPHSTNFHSVIKINDFTQEVIDAEIEKIALDNKLTTKDVLLVTHDEYALDLAANLRVKYGIYGSRPEQVAPYRDKALAKSILKSTSVHTPCYISYNPAQFKLDPQAYVSRIQKALGYPMFAKPIDEARCADVAKITTPEELMAWALKHDAANFEIEEFVNGDLYTSICIVKDGQIVHHGAHKFLYPCFEFMNSKKPLGGISLPNNHPDVIELKGISEVILGKFPIADAVIHIEMMKNKAGEFVFIEAAARQPGGYISDLYYKKSDIHLGKTNFMLQLQLPVNVQEANHMFAAWYWPHKPTGKVKELHLPQMRSKFKPEWRVEKDGAYEGSQFLGDSALRLLVWNADYDELLQDMDYLEKAYNPVTTY
jgi:hypothetical protein